MTSNPSVSAAAPALLDPAVPRIRVVARAAAWARGSQPTAEPQPGPVVLAVPVAEGRPLPTDGPVGDVLRAAGLDPAAVTSAHHPSGRAGEVVLLAAAPGSTSPSGAPLEAVAVYGTGPVEADGPAAVLGGRSDLVSGAGLGRAVRGRPFVEVVAPELEANGGRLDRFVEGLVLGGYSAPRWGTPTPAAEAPAGDVLILTSGSAGSAEPADTDGAFKQAGQAGQAEHAGRADADDASEQGRRAVIRARATLVARNLAATPSNLKSPAWLVAQAGELAGRAGLRTTVWDEDDLQRDGFGGLLAVGGGSATPPRLVQLSYEPEPDDREPNAKEPDARELSVGEPNDGDPGPVEPAARPLHVVLVGKGITFDTGGLDLKPADAMLGMKTDMSGAAVVLSVLAACRDLGIRVRVTGLLALAENAVGGGAYRPGDVIQQYAGRTVEIGNTDAEGRIVLADALAYADAVLEPDVLVDVATLTGAASVALGRGAAPLYATDDGLRDALVEAGVEVGEPLWPFPLPADYRPMIDSDVADLAQVADRRWGGGSIMAALFLREFAGDRAWAHLDIAGAGRAERTAAHVRAGPTAFGARVLLTYLEGRR